MSAPFRRPTVHVAPPGKAGHEMFAEFFDLRGIFLRDKQPPVVYQEGPNSTSRRNAIMAAIEVLKEHAGGTGRHGLLGQ
jgi:hypothetical protein